MPSFSWVRTIAAFWKVPRFTRTFSELFQWITELSKLLFWFSICVFLRYLFSALTVTNKRLQSSDPFCLFWAVLLPPYHCVSVRLSFSACLSWLLCSFEFLVLLCSRPCHSYPGLSSKRFLVASSRAYFSPLRSVGAPSVLLSFKSFRLLDHFQPFWFQVHKERSITVLSCFSVLAVFSHILSNISVVPSPPPSQFLLFWRVPFPVLEALQNRFSHRPWRQIFNSRVYLKDLKVENWNLHLTLQLFWRYKFGKWIPIRVLMTLPTFESTGA